MSKVEDFLGNEAKGTNIVGATSLEDTVAKLKKPRRVMLLVKAGSAVDAFIDKLVSGGMLVFFKKHFVIGPILDDWLKENILKP